MGGMSEGNPTNFGVDFISSAEGLQLNRAFARITDTKVRRKIVELVKPLAADEVEYNIPSRRVMPPGRSALVWAGGISAAERIDFCLRRAVENEAA